MACGGRQPDIALATDKKIRLPGYQLPPLLLLRLYHYFNPPLLRVFLLPMETSNLKIEQWPISRLLPYARNPRKNDHAVDQMASVIAEFGFRIPIVARSTGEIVDGHLRLKGAQRLGLETVPVTLADELSDSQIKAFRIVANRSATWAQWDDQLLSLELTELEEIGFDLTLTGFSDDEFERLLMDPVDREGMTDEYEIPVSAENPVSRVGDMWLMGNHRLLCGDATEPESYKLLLGSELADMTFAILPMESIMPTTQKPNYAANTARF
jgi:hypothetical protein